MSWKTGPFRLNDNIHDSRCLGGARSLSLLIETIKAFPAARACRVLFYFVSWTCEGSVPQGSEIVVSSK